MTSHDQYRLSPSLNITRSGRKVLLSRPDPVTGRETARAADPDELLGLKIVAGRLSVAALAREHQLPPGRFFQLLSRLDRRGILQAPILLRRDPTVFDASVDDRWLTATSFELLLQVTNTCNLHCRHCYDRSRSVDMTVAQASHVLDELERFCARHWAQPYISITGGNPLLHREFHEIYQEAVRRGLDIPIVGNPVTRGQLEVLCRIKPPSVYQVSLEGRRTHNDWIRGAGSYDRAMAFLSVLQDTHVESCVMLTATSQNLGEILPLAVLLEGRTNGFSFSRLARSGEGAALNQPDPVRYRAFLKRYVTHAERSPVSTLKENLINLTLTESGRQLSDGCTGVGCGAAFNFLGVLPDGRVYACRKFPSFLGNIYEQSLEEIYFSPEAARYRRGMRACDGCPIRHACGGCMAAAQPASQGVSAGYDRYCWRASGQHTSVPECELPCPKISCN